MTVQKDLRQVALTGTFWSAVQQGARRAIRFLIILILARFVSPESFGLVALATAFVELLRLFEEQGLTAAIVQRDELEPEHLHSAFWANVVSGVLLSGFGCMIAGVFARVVGQPDLASVVRWLAIGLLARGASEVPEAILRRGLRFKALATRAVIGESVSGGVAVVLALAGWGLWSLVAMQLVNHTVGAVFVWRASRWRPRFVFSLRQYRELASFGLNIMWVHVVRFMRKWADSFVIGVFLGPIALGYYTVARQLVNGVATLITDSLGPVVWSTLSRLQGEPERMRRAIYQAAELTAVIAWPAYLGIATLAPELVSTLLGEQWMMGVPVVRAFALLAGAEIINASNLSAIAAMGESRWQLRLEGLVAGVALVAIAAALPHGFVAVAWAFAGSLYLLLPIQLWVAVRLLPIELAGYLRRHLYPITGSIFMALVVVALRQAVGEGLSGPHLLTALVITGALVYFGFLMLVAPSTVLSALDNIRLAVKPVSDG